MITQEDIKALTGPPDKHYVLVKYLIIFCIALSIISSGYNLYLSINYAHPNKPSVTNAIILWNSEKSLHETYTGLEHHSLLKLNNSILSIGVALILSIQLFSLSKSRSRNKRILASLKECGAIN